MSTIGRGLSALICKMLPQIQIITKKYKFPCSAVNVRVTLGGKEAKLADRSLSQEKQGPKKNVFSILMVIYDVNK